MSDGFTVDLAGFDAILNRFSAGVEDLAGAGKAAPTAMPAGLGSQATSAMVTHLLRNAGNLCAGLEDASAGVLATREGYLSADDSAASRASGLLAER